MRKFARFFSTRLVLLWKSHYMCTQGGENHVSMNGFYRNSTPCSDFLLHEIQSLKNEGILMRNRGNTADLNEIVFFH